MKNLLTSSIVLFSLIACSPNKEQQPINSTNGKENTYKQTLPETLISGKTYLSVYSQIYSDTEHRTHNLTATVSIRNTSEQDTIFITSAKLFDTKGNLKENYFPKQIFLQPMETVEIIINDKKETKGTGSNFIFDWRTKSQTTAPLFEAVMISTSGQQGLSFSTKGKRLK